MARETDTVKSKQRGGQAKEEEESEKHKVSRQQSGGLKRERRLLPSLCAEEIVNRNFKCGGGAVAENTSCAHVLVYLLPGAQLRFPTPTWSVDCFLKDMQTAKQRLKHRCLLAVTIM